MVCVSFPLKRGTTSGPGPGDAQDTGRYTGSAQRRRRSFLRHQQQGDWRGKGTTGQTALRHDEGNHVYFSQSVSQSSNL